MAIKKKLTKNERHWRAIVAVFATIVTCIYIGEVLSRINWVTWTKSLTLVMLVYILNLFYFKLIDIIFLRK